VKPERSPGPTRAVFGHVARNSRLLHVVSAYALFMVCEYGLWIAMLVYAYGEGGATAAGLVALAQLIPSAAVGVMAGPLADRTSPVRLLVMGYAAQAAAAVATTAALFSGLPPIFVYAGAVLLSSAIAVVRPTQSALLPALTREVDELTAANVLIGWVESLSILAAGVGTGVALTFGTVGHVFGVSAVMLSAAALLVAPLLNLALNRRGAATDEGRAPAGHVIAKLWRHRPARLLTTLLGTEYVVIGALDVLFVVMAVDLLDAGEAWVGYLNTAYGAGAVLLGALAALLVGRRLGPVVVATALGAGAALAATAFAGLAGVVLLLSLLGGARALFDVSVRVLLQRSVAPDLLARMFGLAEGTTMMGLAVGSLLAPALVALGGPQTALVGVAFLLPAVVLLRLSVLYRVDRHARVPVVEIALLRQLPIFRLLPGEELEGLARGLERVVLSAGDVLVREGDVGDCYFAIADGSVEIRRHGAFVRTLARGDGLGEIALLRSVRRTATAVARTPVTAYRLERDAFLTAVAGHVPTLESAERIVHETQAADVRRELPPPTPPE
jgi:MFS family permease